MEQMTFDELAAMYCERQVSTPEELRQTLVERRDRFKCDGFMLLECHQMDSTHCGELTVLPYGPNNTFKEVTNRPISPRGLASDMSVCVGYLLSQDLP